MNLLVFLGNTGAKYTNTRHNVAFIIADEIVQFYNMNFDNSKKHKAEIAKVTINNQKYLLAKPTTMMNLSGQAVTQIYLEFKPSKMIVVHDELDLEFGKIKHKLGGSDNGHNGLKSITSAVGSQYYRIRYGIGRPKKLENEEQESVSDYVLSNFSLEQIKSIKASRDQILSIIQEIK